MNRYQTLQHTVSSDAPLHLPPTHAATLPDLLLRRRQPRDPWPQTLDCYKTIPDGDRIWGTFSHAPNGAHVIDYPDYVTFLVSPSFREILYHPAPNCSPATLDHFILDQAIPLVLSGRGLTILHCSAVHLPHGIVAFLGPSGSGKSTLAASFAREGFPLACDDCLLVRETPAGYLAVPAYPGVRLWNRSLQALFPTGPAATQVTQFSAKKRVVDREDLPFSPDPAPLLALYVLQTLAGAAGPVEPLTGAAAVNKLLESCFLLTDKLPGPMRSIFSTLAGLAAAGLVRTLPYPAEFHHLPAVRRQVLQHTQPCV